MDHTSRAFSLATFVALGMHVLSGCGDAGMFSRGEFRAMSASKIGSDIDEERVSVKRVSPRCDANAATACPEAAAPALEVHVAAHSLILDFSNVEAPGVFDPADFDGLEISLADTHEEGALYFVSIDTSVTTIDVDEATIDYDRHYVDINLAGLRYDSGTFVKIDLLLGPLKLFGHGDS